MYSKFVHFNTCTVNLFSRNFPCFSKFFIQNSAAPTTGFSCKRFSCNTDMDNLNMVSPQAQNLLKKFIINEQQMNDVMNRMSKEIQMGLSKETHARSVVKCWITYVQDLPTGKERGKFLALDLGGTNFRVLMVTIKNENDVNIETKAYVLSKEVITGPGAALFDQIAECLDNFVRVHKVENDELPLGFTFSFPVLQAGLDKGILVTWTKGFNCSGVVNQDVVSMLRAAIARRGNLKVNIVALLNDTTGTLMSCAWKHRNCRIGLIVGTGCNACYVEKTSNVQMFDSQNNHKPNMIVNSEWGAFGDNGVLDFVRTEYDKEIDKQTFNSGKQLYEKCIAGMYLGEIVRKVTVKLMNDGILFEGHKTELLNEPWKFNTKYISECENDPPGVYKNTQMVLDRFGIRNSTESDLVTFRYICEIISSRSACLVACGLSCLVNRIALPDISIGIDGGVYRYHPKYHQLLMEYMKKLVKPEYNFQLVLSEDGSGRGAALIAAVSASNQ